MRTLERFATWAEVLAHVAAGKPVWYQAPLDWRAVLVRAAARPKGTVVHVRPWGAGRGVRGPFSPFSANAGHLDRFRRQADEAPLVWVSDRPEEP